MVLIGAGERVTWTPQWILSLPQNLTSPLTMSVKRFCRQYLQLELSLDFPAPELLREEATQDEIYNVFTTHPQPPVRYRLRTLKELIKRIESSIDDWDSHVSCT